MGHWALRVASHSRHGGGHLARIRVLAKALKVAGEEVTLVLDQGANAAKQVIQGDSLRFCKVAEALQGQFSGIVLDGYEIIRNEVSLWINRAAPVVVIDDFLNPPAGVSLVINSAPHLVGGQVNGIRALLGSRYALVDPIYASLPDKDRSKPVQRLLVSFGRIDPDNLTERTLAALAMLQYPPIVEVVIASRSPHRKAVEAALRRLGNASTLTFDAPNLIEQLALADLAIGAGGVSLLERMAAGVPSVSIAIVDNQRAFVEGANIAGGTIGIGDIKDASVKSLNSLIKNIIMDASLRSEMAVNARCIVDGHGPNRVVEELIGLLAHSVGLKERGST